MCGTFFLEASSVHSWLYDNLNVQGRIVHGHFGNNWSVLFGYIISNVWRAHNELVFSGKEFSWDNIVYKATLQMNEFLYATSTEGVKRTYKDSMVGWSFPPTLWVKVNVDGSVSSSKEASRGGVFRDDVGRWILGFVGNLGTCSVLMAEL